MYQVCASKFRMIKQTRLWAVSLIYSSEQKQSQTFLRRIGSYESRGRNVELESMNRSCETASHGDRTCDLASSLKVVIRSESQCKQTKAGS